MSTGSSPAMTTSSTSKFPAVGSAEGSTGKASRPTTRAVAPKAMGSISCTESSRSAWGTNSMPLKPPEGLTICHMYSAPGRPSMESTTSSMCSVV